MAKETSLSNPSKLGLHLSAGASDGFLTSANFILDETLNQSIQTTLDDLRTKGAGIVDVFVNGVSVVNEDSVAEITLPGLSIQLEEGDISEITTEGYYFANDTEAITGKPSEVTNFGLKVQKTSTGKVQQILFTEDNDVYMRTGGDIFGSWVKLVKDSSLANYVLSSSLHQVAFSGSYNDLTDKPTIDSELDAESENAVQNKVVTAALDLKLDEEDVDSITSTELDELLN